MKLVQKKAGAGVPSANRITLLRDADGDGVAEISTPYLTGLTSPFGMAVVGSTLYVADADALLAFPYDPGATSMSGRVYSDPFWVVRYRNSDGTLRGNGDSADSCDDAARKAIGAVLLHIACRPVKKRRAGKLLMQIDHADVT